MKHQISADDRSFMRAFEACQVKPEAFDHPAHVRLAYIYLCAHSIDESTRRMKKALLGFLAHLGVPPAKYHETITRAWVMAVWHFMVKSAPCNSAAAFMRASPQLLDSKIMLTHYSAELLFSPKARETFVEPDVQAIPRH